MGFYKNIGHIITHNRVNDVSIFLFKFLRRFLFVFSLFVVAFYLLLRMVNAIDNLLLKIRLRYGIMALPAYGKFLESEGEK